MPRALNLTNKRFGRLVVLEQADSIGGLRAWKCQCDCGVIKNIKQEYLTKGDTKSCGCLNNDSRSARAWKMHSASTKYHPQVSMARVIWKDNYYEMNFEDFYKLSQKNCFYCNMPPSNIYYGSVYNENSKNPEKHKPLIYNGIDRIDSNKNHSMGNVVPCCKTCNKAKRERSFQDFIKWSVDVYNFLIKQCNFNNLFYYLNLDKYILHKEILNNFGILPDDFTYFKRPQLKTFKQQNTNSIDSVTKKELTKDQEFYSKNKKDPSIIGVKFNRLTVLKIFGKINTRLFYTCKCDCGTIKNIKATKLISGHTKSCGCLAKEHSLKNINKMVIGNIKYTVLESLARQVHRGVYKDMIYNDFYKLSQENCFYCNLKPSNETWKIISENGIDKKIVFNYNGIDRIDSNKGHDMGNVVPCCKWCNLSKNNMSFDEFKSWIEKLHLHLIENNNKENISYYLNLTSEELQKNNTIIIPNIFA